jgi:hypothetical protein
VEHYGSKLRGTPLLSRTSVIDLQHLRYSVAAAEHGSFVANASMRRADMVAG